jgi:serine/threonine protein phosphatase PrpC
MGSFLKEAFRQTQAQTLNLNDGATGTVAAVSVDNTLTLAHLGDSPAMLMVRDGQTGKVQVHNLLKEHKPSDPEERARIESEGGFILDRKGTLRIIGTHGGALAVARAFGDNKYPGVGHVPDITTLKIDEYAKPGDQVFLCVACDGLLEANKPEDFAQILEKQMNQGNSQNLADHFVNMAYQSGSRDNITAMVVEIPPTRDRDLIIGVADGHGGRATADLVVDNLKKMTLKTTAELMADGAGLDNGPATAQPRETSPAAPAQAEVPDVIDLGEGFKLGKKTYPTGETLYRIIGVNGTNTAQAIQQAKQQGFDVKERQFADGMRLVAEPAEVEASWQRRNVSTSAPVAEPASAPTVLTPTVSTDVPLKIDLGEGYKLARKTYPEGDVYRITAEAPVPNIARAKELAEAKGFTIEERSMGGKTIFAADPVEVAAVWQYQQAARTPANDQMESLITLNKAFLINKRGGNDTTPTLDPMQERQMLLNDETSAQLGGATWQINEGKGNVSGRHLRLSLDSMDDALRMCTSMETAGIPCTYARKGDKSLVIVLANDVERITPDRAKSTGEIYQAAAKPAVPKIQRQPMP